jgi:hypothetical protein
MGPGRFLNISYHCVGELQSDAVIAVLSISTVGSALSHLINVFMSITTRHRGQDYAYFTGVLQSE